MAMANGLRNDSYYMATNETWSPMIVNGNSSVLIEEDAEPMAQYVFGSVLFASFVNSQFPLQTVPDGLIDESNQRIEWQFKQNRADIASVSSW